MSFFGNLICSLLAFGLAIFLLFRSHPEKSKPSEKSGAPGLLQPDKTHTDAKEKNSVLIDSKNRLSHYQFPWKSFTRVPWNGTLSGKEFLRRDLENLLWNGQFDELETKMCGFQELFEKDATKDTELVTAFETFRIPAEPLEARLDDWIQAKPDSYSAYQARAIFFMNLALLCRGTNWAKNTSSEQFDCMSHYFKRASADVREALNRKKELLVAYRVLLVIATNQGSENEKEEFIQQGLALFPDSLWMRSRVLWALTPRWGGSYERMIEIIAETESHVSRNPQLSVLGGWIADDQADLLNIASNHEDKPEKINALLQQSIDKYGEALRHGEYFQFYIGRAKIFLQTKRFQDGLMDLQRVTELKPELEIGWLLKAYAELNLSRYEDAIRDAQKALSIWPYDEELKGWTTYFSDSAINAAWNLSRSGQGPKSLEIYDLAQKVSPSYANTYYWRGCGLMQQGLWDQSLKDFKQSIELDPSDFKSYQALDQVLFRSNQYDEIIQYWTRYISLIPDNGKAFLERAGTYYHKGDFESSLQDAEKALSLGATEAEELVEQLKMRLNK